MKNTIKKAEVQDYQALYETLEERYGPAIAQNIIDEVKKTDNPAYTPEYVDVRLLSDVVEDLPEDMFGFSKIIRQTYEDLYRRAMNSWSCEYYLPKKQLKKARPEPETAMAA